MSGNTDLVTGAPGTILHTGNGQAEIVAKPLTPRSVVEDALKQTPSAIAGSQT